MNKWIGIGALLLALAVACGAFGAHALKSRLDSYSLSIFDRGVFYHFIHAIGILIVAILALTSFLTLGSANKICLIFLFGIIFFSGSLYTLAITGIREFGAITPIGGLLFIVGWLYLCVVSFLYR